jgi:anti-anti-sigma factor
MSTPASERSFYVHTRRAEDTVIADVHGKLTFDHAPQLRNKIRTLILEEKRIVLDLKDVPLMDSSGLGTLVSLYVTARGRGCKLELIHLSSALRTLLSVANVLSLFEPAGRYGGRMS